MPAILREVWIGAPVGYTMGNLAVPSNPKVPNGNINGKGTIADPGTYGLSSDDPGGARVRMADSSVRPLEDSIGDRPSWSPGRRAGGQVLATGSC